MCMYLLALLYAVQSQATKQAVLDGEHSRQERLVSAPQPSTRTARIETAQQEYTDST